MIDFFNYQYNKNMVSINLAEYFVTEEDLIIHTILGSCISVCLFIPDYNITGMNHFMLPSNPLNNVSLKPGQYGINSMELLFSEFVKKGISIKSLKAKVYGGGNITMVNNENNIGSNNIKFIFDFLKTEGIPVMEKDVGGFAGRKIIYFTRTHEVKVIMMKKTIKIKSAEEMYQRELKKKIESEPDITFFK
jgi:chemotaxis protein CheD